MKRKTAKEILLESFRELAEKKSVDKITVQDITENCGYSTTTFYRHFRDKYDLIGWDHTSYVAKVMNQIGVDDYSWRQTLLEGVNYFEQNKAYLANLIKHTNGHNSFVRNMTEINYEALKGYILKYGRIKELDEKTDMYIRIYCLGTVNLICEWILGRYHVTTQELAEILERSLPGPLHQYLY